MPFLTWNDKVHGVGVQRFDQEHQKLFAIINELHDAMRAGQGRLKVADILGRLTKYTVEHFAGEEAAMRAANYPGAASHAAEHAKLKNQVKTFLAELEAGKSMVTIELMNFLRDWLERHIQQSDRQYKTHLSNQTALSAR